MGGLRIGVSPVPRRLARVPGTAGAWGGWHRSPAGWSLGSHPRSGPQGPEPGSQDPLVHLLVKPRSGLGAHLPGPYSSSSKAGKIMAPTPTSDHTSWHQANQWARWALV